MIAAKTKYFKIKNPETGEFDSFIFIKGDKGWIVGPDQITSELGTSEELVVSQLLAHTLNIDIQLAMEQLFNRDKPSTLISRLESIESALIALGGQISGLDDRIHALETK